MDSAPWPGGGTVGRAQFPDRAVERVQSSLTGRWDRGMGWEWKIAGQVKLKTGESGKSRWKRDC